MVAAAAGAVDAGLATQIRGEPDWRTAYPAHFRQLTKRAATSAHAGAATARAGLTRMHATFEHVANGKAMSVLDAAARGPGAFHTVTVAGEGQRQATLEIPYRGRVLRDGELLAAVDSWVDRGIAEPAVRTAIERLVDNPEWLDLRGMWFAALGAAAEMAPTAPLLAWGADVAAVDIANDTVWRRLESLARDAAGSLHAPRSTDSEPPGADLLTEAGHVRAWLSAFETPLVLGNYGYADGSMFTRLSVAADGVIAVLLDERTDHGVVCLATPTDVFAVPQAVVTETRSAFPFAVVRGATSLLPKR